MALLNIIPPKITSARLWAIIQRYWPLLPLLFCLLVLTTCGRVDIEWKEEVRLDNGEIIVAKRTAKGKSLGEIGGSGGWKVSTMTVELIDTKSLPAPPVWEAEYAPILIDYDQASREWFLIATFYTCEPWYELGRPVLPYIYYRVESGEWKQAPLDPSLIGRQTNLLAGPSSRGEEPLVTLSEKEPRRRRAGKSYQTILGEWYTAC